MSKANWCEILKINQEQIEDIRLAAYAYIRQGKYDIALKLFEALDVLDPNDVYNAQTLGALYIELGEPEKSLPYLDKALKYDTDHTPTLLNLCKALFMLDKAEEGLRLAKILSTDANINVANTAKALLMAFG